MASGPSRPSGRKGAAKVRVVAIDGPAGSGKSTVAAEVAARLGLSRLDTGAMYRAVALAVARRGVDPADASAVTAVAMSLDIDPGPPVMLDGEDVSEEIRGAAVTSIVSDVSSHPGVRREMVRRQRVWARQRGGGVVEGRDIGSVVFPDAELKVYLTASATERARRRAEQERRIPVEQESPERAVAADLDRRDRLDSSRAESPLVVAEGAVVVDTTGLSVEEAVGRVMALL